MKLGIFSITAILTSLVAANPILAPRAPSPSFKLWGQLLGSGSDSLMDYLTILPITEPNKPVYYGFGWYGQGSQPIDLFLREADQPGRALDVRQNGYEMIFQAVPDQFGGTPYCYRPLLINPANTAVVGLESTSKFFLYSGYQFYSGAETDHPDDPNGWQWTTCVRSETMDPKNVKYVEELYFCSSPLPSGCSLGRGPVTLNAEVASDVAVKLAAAVNV
ncbi:hypothetical protein Q9L58_005605 [Maublancomyces gigas]|uniref:Uncharacterized protein n=1 Tax=Discina gigas TaxID=1032678 RepID=A0ABR3GHZ8_9PEZI